MANGVPSMMALLGLLAVAGYQNRDRLGHIIADATGQPFPQGDGFGADAAPPVGSQSLLQDIAMLFSGSSGGNALSEGLGALLNQFRMSGMGDLAQSWVARGPSRPVDTDQLERSIGAYIIVELAQKTGLSRDTLLTRLARALPEAVDQLTLHGHIPAGGAAQSIV